MTVEWTDDPAAFGDAAWAGLCDADPEATIFHTPGYLKLFWEQFAPGGLRVAFVRDGADTVAAAAFEIRDGAAAFLGGSEVTDYLGPVGLPAAREPAAGELLASLDARGDWDTADLRGLPDEGAWRRALEAAAPGAGLRAEAAPDNVAMFLPLPGSFEEYLRGLPRKQRHEVRRKERRLRRSLPSVRLVDAEPGTLSADLARFAELHRRSPGPKGRFMHPGMERFFRRLAEALLPDGTFRLAYLEADGAMLSAAVGFRDRRRFLLYNSAFDHARAHLSPGIVLIAELIRGAIAEEREALDLLRGGFAYKHRFGARPRRITRLLLRRD